MPKSTRLHIQPHGILRLSTALVLAGGTMMLTHCDDRESEQAGRQQQDAIRERARAQSELDSARRALESGMVANNYNIPRVGYYHAAVGTFYETEYNQEKDGRFFVNGQWQDQRGPLEVPSSRPTIAELARIEALMATIQAEESNEGGGTTQIVHHHGGSGFMNGMMMYWLLSGNRNAGYYSPGPGFTRASAYTSDWQRKYQDERAAAAQTSRGYGSSGTTSYGARSSSSTSSWGSRPASSSSSSGSSSSPSSTDHSSSSSGGNSSNSHASSSSGGGESSGSSHSSTPSSRGGFGSSSHGSSSS
jgi:hypothetical protein